MYVLDSDQCGSILHMSSSFLYNISKFCHYIRIRQRPGIRGLKTRVPTGIYIEKCCVINMAISHTHSLDTAILHSD